VIGDSLGRILVWDAGSGEKLFDLIGHIGQINDLNFSPDGRRLASASGDATVKVWDAVSGDELFTLPGGSGPVFAVPFSMDGKRLASFDSAGTLRIYAMGLEDLVALAKSRVTRALTEVECRRYLHLDACPSGQ
jgi:WD40 repeat protein